MAVIFPIEQPVPRLDADVDHLVDVVHVHLRTRDHDGGEPADADLDVKGKSGSRDGGTLTERARQTLIPLPDKFLLRALPKVCRRKVISG
jgi:hypothetical protein